MSNPRQCCNVNVNSVLAANLLPASGNIRISIEDDLLDKQMDVILYPDGARAFAAELSGLTKAEGVNDEAYEALLAAYQKAVDAKLHGAAIEACSQISSYWFHRGKSHRRDYYETDRQVQRKLGKTGKSE